MDITGRIFLTRAVCLLLMAGITLSNFGGIMCLGEDGHVKVESYCHPSCNDSEGPRRLEEVTTDSDNHDDCADCTDLPLLHDSLAHRYAFRILRTGSYIDYSIAVPYIPHRDRAVSAFIRVLPKIPTVSEPFAVLSTSVLLC